MSCIERGQPLQLYEKAAQAMIPACSIKALQLQQPGRPPVQNTRIQKVDSSFVWVSLVPYHRWGAGGWRRWGEHGHLLPPPPPVRAPYPADPAVAVLRAGRPRALPTPAGYRRHSRPSSSPCPTETGAEALLQPCAEARPPAMSGQGPPRPGCQGSARRHERQAAAAAGGGAEPLCQAL